MPSSATIQAIPSAWLHSSTGKPVSELRLPLVHPTGYEVPSSAVRNSLVVVLPIEPVTAARR